MEPVRSGAFLRRLARDTTGHTLGIMAAAFFPMAAVIGGGVDMARIYITKTRLQQACDAGALAGRKVMGSGAWTTTGTNSSRSQAELLFASNFKSGDFGTENLSRNFTEAEGTVTGVASTDVPMTLMKIFGEEEREVSVTCTAEMEIPNTDVMFVLDVTGSMDGANMIGLKSAVKCFYEALVQVNTPEVCGTSDPTNTDYNGTAQIRLGFVPYSVNVNVGKLLPNEYFADEWVYQTRKPNFETVYSWTEATGPINWGNWPNNQPNDLNDQSTYTDPTWSNLNTSPATITIGSTTYTKRLDLGQTSCNNLNTIGPAGNKMLAYVVNPPVTADPTYSNGAPVYPTTQQTLNYTQVRTTSVNGYKYRYFSSSTGTNRCRLQGATRSYTTQRTGTGERHISWQEHQRFTGTWTYFTHPMDVSGFKNGGSTWNNSAPIPGFSTTAGPTVRLSGSYSATPLTVAAPLTLEWKGCVEERRATHKVTDSDPSDDWDPVPDDALDLDIDMIPSSSTPNSQWAPMLRQAYWARTSGGSYTTNSVTTTSSSSFTQPQDYCSTEARKLKSYDTSADLVSYINSFKAEGNTYHDVGMLWGARLLSPTGIFASENAETANGGAIERHLIFMTDGDANTDRNNLYSFGLPTHDRRQFGTLPSNAQLTSAVEARLTALCTQIKNMNIKLWVISYGGDVNEDNEDRLEACASPGHFYSASNGPALIAQFKQIASEIADLRLTQ